MSPQTENTRIQSSRKRYNMTKYWGQTETINTQKITTDAETEIKENTACNNQGHNTGNLIKIWTQETNDYQNKTGSD